MGSLWSETKKMPSFDALPGDMKTDVLIVGGGIAGILCAYMLAQAGVDYALVEADRICGGITCNTTAKITSQHGLIYSKLVRNSGKEAAELYLRANQDALETYRRLCRGIDCDFEEKDAYVYSTDSCRKVEDELDALESLGFEAYFANRLPLPFHIAGAVCFPAQAQFHPLKFLSAIARNLRIYENTKVLELAPGAAKTDRGMISAEKIIVATHFPVVNKHGSYFLKLYQHRSYVIALENAPCLDGMYIDENEKGLSFRNHRDLLLVGGGSHRTGKRGGGWQELSGFARTYYPQARETAHWATQDCMTLDGVPYVGRYSKNTPDMYVASGFNKWGMTSSMAAAMLLTDMVLDRENPVEELFSPSRSILHPQLAANGFEAIVNLLTPTVPRCPHMGCALKWNAQERSWDCPCHGSRFSEHGVLIDNPATDDKRMK